MKPTKGPWRLEVDGWQGQYIYGIEEGRDKERLIAEVSLDYDSASSNARLIAEAGTVYHETGLTPREILAHREALRAALFAATCYMDRVGMVETENLRAAAHNALDAVDDGIIRNLINTTPEPVTP